MYSSTRHGSFALLALHALFALFALAALTACSDAPNGSDASGHRDASEPEVIVIDVDSGEVIDASQVPVLDASDMPDVPDASVVVTTTPDGGTCAIHVQRHRLLDAPHIGAPLLPSAYNSSPPSSGPHCDQWGAFATYSEQRALPACYFLHNLEHAGVALLYNCPDGCPEIASALEQAKTDAAADPDCAQKRVLITPYADMDATIAAAAWGFTWTTDCEELYEPARASLLDFIAAHLGSNGLSPEPRVCGDGAIAP